MNSRTFNSKQKFALILQSGGRCESCNKKLENCDVHFNHNQPYSLGGKSKVENGSAYCARCNLKLGNSFPGLNKIKLRKWQQQTLVILMEKMNDK